MPASPERSATSANHADGSRASPAAAVGAARQGERALLGVLLVLTVLSGVVDGAAM